MHVCQQNNVGQTALHMMAKFNHYRAEECEQKKEIAQLLLDAGAHVDVVDTHGNTPMHIACMTTEPCPPPKRWIQISQRREGPLSPAR